MPFSLCGLRRRRADSTGTCPQKPILYSTFIGKKAYDNNIIPLAAAAAVAATRRGDVFERKKNEQKPLLHTFEPIPQRYTVYYVTYLRI